MQQQRPTHDGLSHPAMLILASLEQGLRHALALCETIEQTEGLFIEPGTLYRALARLERQGQVEVLDEDTQEGPLRLYRITVSGMLAIERASARQPHTKPRAGERPLLSQGKEIIMRLVLWMLRLYPPAWRERYETEMVALLQQHEITPWTVLDLLMGALDARLDPHYRGSRPLLTWRQLKNSWKLYASSLITFCFALPLWLNMGDMGQDLRGTGATCASPGYNYAICMMRQAVALQTPAVVYEIVMLTSFFSLLIIFLLLFTVAVWAVTQTFVRKNAWYLLRLLPIASFSILFWLIDISSSLSGWQNTLGQIGVVASAALIVESGGAMFVSLNRWQQRPNRQSAILARVLALLLTIGMAAICIAGGIWIAALWNVFPQINLYYPGTQTQLLLGLALTTLASISAISTLIRGSRALRDIYAANLPLRDTAPSKSKGWSALLIVPFVIITFLVIISSLTHMIFALRPIFIPIFILILLTMISGTLISRATLRNKEEHPGLPRQEPLQQMQE